MLRISNKNSTIEFFQNEHSYNCTTTISSNMLFNIRTYANRGIIDITGTIRITAFVAVKRLWRIQVPTSATK